MKLIIFLLFISCASEQLERSISSESKKAYNFGECSQVTLFKLFQKNREYGSLRAQLKIFQTPSFQKLFPGQDVKIKEVLKNYSIIDETNAGFLKHCLKSLK